MALEDLRNHAKATISDAINDIPQRPREQLKRSFLILLGIAPGKWDRALSLAACAFDSSFPIDEAELSRDFGISTNDAKHVISGATFFGAMLAAHPEATPTEFVTALVKNNLLEVSSTDLALELAEVVAKERHALTQDFEKSTLRNSVLPSLRRLETAVDVRLSSSKSLSTSAVPVVLLMVDTDADRETLWCQLSKYELKAIIAKLESTLEKVEFAESWIDSKGAFSKET